MRRRDFIKGIAGSTVVWPLAARAQQSAMPVVGFIRTTSAAASTPLVAAFRKGLAEAGLVEGKDVAIELRFADDDFGRLPALASDLVRRGVAVIVGNNFAVPAIRSVTTTIPVVFVGGDDPVRTGLVTSLNKPGANITGITSLSYALTTKRLQLLHELAPKSAAIAVLLDPHAAELAPEEREAKEAARALGRDILVVQAGTVPDLEAAFATISRARPGRTARGRRRFSLPQPAPADRCVRCAAGFGSHLFAARSRGGGWPDELWHQPAGYLSPGRCLRGAHSQGREAGGPAGPSTDQVRAGDQPKNRENAWPCNSVGRACDCR